MAAEDRSSDHDSYRHRARRFIAAEVCPAVAAWEATGRLPRPILLRLAEAGLLPVGGDLVAAVTLLEELTAMVPQSFAATVATQLLVARHLVRTGSESLRQRFLEPLQQGRCLATLVLPQSGAAFQAQAEQDRSWLVSGTAAAGAAATVADLVLLAAETGHDRGVGELSLLLVDLDTTGVLLRAGNQGRGGTHHLDLVLEDARVPTAMLVGEQGKGGSHLQAEQPVAQLLAAAMILGAVTRACQDLPAAAAGRLPAAIARARDLLLRAASPELGVRRFRRACSAAEAKIRRVLERLHRMQLARLDSLDLVRDLPGRYQLPASPTPGEGAGEEPPPAFPVSAPAEPDRQYTVGELFASLPQRFRAERASASGWTAVFHFILKSGSQPLWTVQIAQGACRVQEGLHGTADCTVRMRPATYLGIASGRINPQAAFLSGRVKVSDLNQMLRFIKAFRPLAAGGGEQS